MSVKVTIKGQHWVSDNRHLGKMGCAPILSVSVHQKDQKNDDVDGTFIRSLTHGVVSSFTA